MEKWLSYISLCYHSAKNKISIYKLLNKLIIGKEKLKEARIMSNNIKQNRCQILYFASHEIKTYKGYVMYWIIYLLNDRARQFDIGHKSPRIKFNEVHCYTCKTMRVIFYLHRFLKPNSSAWNIIKVSYWHISNHKKQKLNLNLISSLSWLPFISRQVTQNQRLETMNMLK